MASCSDILSYLGHNSFEINSLPCDNSTLLHYPWYCSSAHYPTCSCTPLYSSRSRPGRGCRMAGCRSAWSTWSRRYWSYRFSSRIIWFGGLTEPRSWGCPRTFLSKAGSLSLSYKLQIQNRSALSAEPCPCLCSCAAGLELSYHNVLGLQIAVDQAKWVQEKQRFD